MRNSDLEQVSFSRGLRNYVRNAGCNDLHHGHCGANVVRCALVGVARQSVPSPTPFNFSDQVYFFRRHQGIQMSFEIRQRTIQSSEKALENDR
jgi:hypothetical protein